MQNREITKDELNEILRNGVEGGVSIRILYLMPTNVYKTKKAWRKDDVSKVLRKYSGESGKNWHKTLSEYNDNGKGHDPNPLYQSITLADYTLPFTTISDYKAECKRYTEGINALRESLSISLERPHANSNPAEVKDGYLVNAAGNQVHKLNMAKAESSYANYMIGDDGNIGEEFPSDVTTAMKGLSSNIEKYVAQQLSDEDLEVYKQKRMELDSMFRSQEFLYDSMVAVAITTLSGELRYYNPNAKPRTFDVNPKGFLDIAKKALTVE